MPVTNPAADQQNAATAAKIWRASRTYRKDGNDGRPVVGGGERNPYCGALHCDDASPHN
jgi:hypothetical protein